MLGALVWAVIAFTCVLRIVVIWGSFFWQDDYIHIWTAWNAPAPDLILQNWNGHREPASFAVQWALARMAPQVWWPAAIVLSFIAVGTTVGFWLMVKRWAGVSPATASAAILFAAWPATMMPQAWLSAGLETVPLVLMFSAGWLLAAPRRWTPWVVGIVAVAAWLFHERAGYFLPFLLAVALFFGGVRRNRASWWVLAAVTALTVVLRLVDDLPGRAGGASVPGALWSAGPGSVLRSVLGWLPYDARTPVPVTAGLWALAVLVVWMILLLIGLSTAPRHTALVAGVVTAFLLVEVLSFVWLRGGFAGGGLAADPRFTLVTGTVLLVGLASFDITWRPVVWVAAALSLVGCWSMWRMSLPEDPGREWLASARQVRGDLAPTPSPPAMLAHFFFTTEPPVYELGTTRTLLQVGPRPPAFPERTMRPVQVDASGQVGPMVFTPLVVEERRQCGLVQVPAFDAGVRVVRVGDEYVFPPPGPIADVAIAGCVDTVEVGIPGR